MFAKFVWAAREVEVLGPYLDGCIWTDEVLRLTECLAEWIGQYHTVDAQGVSISYGLVHVGVVLGSFVLGVHYHAGHLAAIDDDIWPDGDLSGDVQ
jgi:hypothetical protein